MQALLAIAVLFGVLCVAQCRQYTLNVPRVLLPIVPASGVKANFTLKSQAGCFTWKSTKPDVASVKPLFTNGDRQGVGGVGGGGGGGGGGRCSREALLTPQSSEQSRLSTVIIAEEQTTGQTLRCDVFVDTIHRVEITTRTRELLLEEEPERFEILGFDEEGNTFSTLRGHRFDWMLLRDEEATHQTTEPEAILHFVRFDDSSYATDPIIGSLEAGGYHGDTVLVEGVSTGTAKVSVRLVDRVWKDVVAPATVKLLVIENIMLQPAVDVYILPHCTVHYIVERKKQGKTEVVAMPSDQYSLELTNTTVGSLDTQRSNVTGLVVGDTEVVLQDKNMLHTPSATKPTAGVHVVPPHHLGYSILPDNVWVLEVGRQYQITVHVFDKLNHPIMVTENVVMKTVLPTSHLHPLSSSHNGSYHVVAAETTGRATIHSTLTAVKLPNDALHKLTPVVSKDQSLEIYHPIRLQPGRLAILWDPASEFHYQHQMKASGGSGGYVWSCDTEAVAHVTSTGLVTSVAEGKSQVVASDKKNAAHFDKAEVFVVPPSDMLFLPSRVEAPLSTSLSLPLQVRGAVAMGDGEQSLEPFRDCRRMTLSITLSDSSVFNVSVDTETDPSVLPQSSCLSLTALALKPGHTKLTLQYSHRDTHLEASVIIAAYPPLLPVDPPDVAVLTLGSSYDILFEGGPAPWVLDKSKYFQRLSAETPDQVSLYGKMGGAVGTGQHVWRVVCRGLGEQELQLEVGNGPTLKNVQPASEVSVARVSCTLPVSMTMTPVVALSKECPLFQSSNQNARIPVKAGQVLELEVKVFDAENRQFNNYSSLLWTWGSSDQLLLRPPSQGALVHRESQGDFLVVQLSQQSGSVVMTASSESYQPRYLAAEEIDIPSTFSPGVNHSLSLLLRHPPILTPSRLLLYNHNDNLVTINISNGSDHFVVEASSPSNHRVASTQYSDQRYQISLTPLADGEVTIRCRDVCLASANEVIAVVTVAGIHSLSVQVSDKVQVGSSIQAVVKVLDRRGHPFTADQHKFMQLQSNPKSHHIETEAALIAMETLRSHDSELLAHSSVFTVLGRVVGHTHLLFNVTTPTGHAISSTPAPVQVFDPLKLSPRHIVLLPTATFQIHSNGGPMLEAAIKFSISNSGIAMVTEDTGLVEAIKPGQATITGKAQAADPVSGHMTSYSQDEVHLTVLKLTGIRIAIATTRVLAGAELSIHAVGLNDESPFAFASALPGLSFQWSSTNMDVVSLASVYEKAGVSLQEEQDFAARLRTHNPGQGTVKLVATCHAGFCDPDRQVFKDEVKIEVIPPLTLVHPFSGKLLIPQAGRVKIVTSRDGLSVLSYKLFCDDVKGGGGDSVISVSEEGEILAGGVNGHAVVMVTASEEDTGLNQSAIVHVEVATVVALSLSPLSLAQAMPNSKHHAFPLGYSAEFRVTLLDGSGRAFNFAEIPLGYRLNRFDIVRVTPGSNGTYVFKAAAKGQVIIRVFLLPHTRIGDYIRVHVGYAIIPSLAVVHIGTKVCFTTHLTEDSAGEWSTGDRGVMQLSPETGIGTAKSPGRAVIYHKIKGVSDTHTEITVKRVEEVVIKANEKELPLFTNAPRREELGAYSVLVSFYHTQGPRSTTHDKGYFTSLVVSPNPACSSEASVESGGVYLQQVPFECLLELTNNGSPLDSQRFISTRAHFDHKYGTSSCVLLPIKDHQAVEFLSTKDKLSLSLKVKAFDSASTYQVFSSALSIPLLPAFSLSRDNVTLTASDPSTTLSVTGLPRQLQAIQISTPHPLSVTKHTSSDHLFTYLLSLTERHPEPFSLLTITFTSSLTHQVATVTVSYSDATATLGSGAVTTETTSCLATPTSTPTQAAEDTETPPIEATYQFIGENMTLSVVFLVTLLAIVIGLVVICKAFRDGTPRPSGGFTAYLPHSPNNPQQQAFSPSHSPQSFTMTPAIQRTPPIPGSGGQSAFRRTGAPSYSPSSQGLYSQ